MVFLSTTDLVWLTAAVLAAILLYVRRRSSSNLLSVIPSPPSLPVIGHLMEVFCPVEEMVSTSHRWARDYGPVLRLSTLGLEFLLISGPKEFQDISNHQVNLSKGTCYKFLNSWLATGLLTAGGRKWRSRRKMLNPAFHYKILDEFVPVFNRNSAILISKLRELMEQEHVEIEEFVTLCALDNLCETVLGTSVNAQKGEGISFIKAVKRICELFSIRFTSPWLQPPLIWNFSSFRKEEEKVVKIAKDFSGKIIKEKRENRKQKEAHETTNIEETGGKKRLSLLDLMLEMTDEGVELSEEDIREEVDTFMFAGHDTTAAAICWALLLLAIHEDVQDKVAAELSGIFGSDDREPSTADLANMTYMDQVLKETLRMFPSVSFITRKTEVDMKIGEYAVPAGTELVVAVTPIHRNPEIYPDPDKFDPERFCPDQVAGRHSHAFIPFSAGPRNCIGQKFGRLEVKCLLAAILRNFRLTTQQTLEGLSLAYDIVLKPKERIKFKLYPRT